MDQAVFLRISACPGDAASRVHADADRRPRDILPDRALCGTRISDLNARARAGFSELVRAHDRATALRRRLQHIFRSRREDSQ